MEKRNAVNGKGMRRVDSQLVFVVESASSGNEYECTYCTYDDEDAFLTCECKGWRFQKRSPRDRICKHTQVLLELGLPHCHVIDDLTRLAIVSVYAGEKVNQSY